MTTALVVVDMQSAFLAPSGGLAVERAGAGLAAVNQHVPEAVEQHLPIFYTRDVDPTGQAGADHDNALQPDLGVRGTVVDKGSGSSAGPEQYRPCPLPARAAGLGFAGSVAFNVGDVRERADERRGRCAAPRKAWRAQTGSTSNGDRHREFDTRAGSSDAAIPQPREGSYSPDRLLERRRRAPRPR